MSIYFSTLLFIEVFSTLNVLQASGTDDQRMYIAGIIPLVKRHHLLLVTLLLANAAGL